MSSVNLRSFRSTPTHMEPVVRLYIVRHGETNENRTGIMQGQLDTQLNNDGIQQARLCARRLKNVEFAAAFSSDLYRAAKTAEIILACHPDVDLCIDEGLRERHMGVLQGAHHTAYDRTKTHAGMESGDAFAQRAMEWWNHVISKHLPEFPDTPSPFNVLIVSHGAYISTLVRALVATRVVEAHPGVRFGSVYNTSVTTIDMRRDRRGKLVKYADISHLEQPAVAHNADEQPQG